MATVYFLIEGLLVLGLTLTLWRYLCLRLVKSPLDAIPGPPATSFLQGNMSEYFSRHGAEFQERIAQDYGPVVKLHGYLGEKVLYVRDHKALYNILIREENIFEESDFFLRINYYMFGPGLLATLGDVHRKQRKMVNPVFSVSHMRHMLPTFFKVVGKLCDAIALQVKHGPNEVDIVHWTSRVALELIGQGGLGYSFDPLLGDAKDDYAEALKAVFPTLQEIVGWQVIIPYLHLMGPRWFRRWVADRFPVKSFQKLKAIAEQIEDKSTAIFEAKKSALKSGDNSVLRQGVGEGKDIMSILMQDNMAASDDEKLPEDQLIGQMSSFVFAATDTTSNTLARIFQLLAQRPDIQDRLRKEVTEAFSEGDPSYDELMQLPCLDAVCRETLRLFPPVSFTARIATQDSVLPLSKPIHGLDGRMIEEIPVPKGTRVIVGVLGSNTNKAKWGEDALEWKPERWLSALPKSVTEAVAPGVFSHLMTFLGGKRACIGFKFSELEMKVVLSVLLSTFEFESTDKPIFWNMAPVTFPSIDKDSLEPSMPLKVSMIASGKGGTSACI